MRDGQRAEFYFAVSGQKCGSHVLFHVFTNWTSRLGNLTTQVPKVLPRLSILPEKHLTLDQPTIAVDCVDFTHFAVGQWLTHDAFEIAEIVASVGRKWYGYLSALDRPFNADDSRMYSQAIGNLDNHRVLSWHSILGCTIESIQKMVAEPCLASAT